LPPYSSLFPYTTLFRSSRVLFSLSLILIVFIIPATAQEKIRFGKIEFPDLQMKRYAADTSAHAVILYDKGVLDGNSGKFTRHVRSEEHTSELQSLRHLV